MKITILGSGTLLSGPKRLPSAFLLESGEEKAVLDMGPGILAQVHKLGISPLDIKTVLLTHFHLDHCADVFPLLMNRFLIDPDANNNLVIYGPSNIEDWFETIASTQGSWLHNCLPRVSAIQSGKVEWSGNRIQVCLNDHTETSLAYRFEGQASYFFSSDTGFNEKLIPFASGCDIGFMECSHPDEEKQTQHLTPSEVGIFAQQAGFKKLVVNHMYPSNDTPDLADKIAKHFGGQIQVAEDLLVIKESIGQDL